MQNHRSLRSSSTRPHVLALLGLTALYLAGCDGSDGSTGPPGAPGPPGPPGGETSQTETNLPRGAEVPGIVLTIQSLSGASGPEGNFRPGDTISIRYTVEKQDGSLWDLAELASGRTLVSGPTFNYQRVIAEQSDVLSASTANGDGSYTYTFALPLPARYLPPLNDTASFGAEHGELTDQPLLPGTYTLGLYVTWNFTAGGQSKRDAANAVQDFLLGAEAGLLSSREVVAQANCNRCHDDLRAHGGQRRNVTLCLMCHTAGAEDRNVPSVAGGTPGVTIEFKSLIHRIHNGGHLPSVLGVSTHADGTRDYDAPPVPFEVVGYGNNVNDFSGISFPVMPSAYVAYLFDQSGTTYIGTGGNGPMPRDVGYSTLPLPHKLVEDKVRTGLVSCEKCHGDPDGDAPLGAPAQGDLAYSRPSRAACGSCHDDVVWEQPYRSNGMQMPAQLSDTACTQCHAVSGSGLAVRDAHLHPYSNPSFNTGVNVRITGVAGGTGPAGNHRAGDRLEVTFEVEDDAGVDLAVHRLTRFQMICTGPTTSPQWVQGNINVFDFAFRKSSPFTGNGTVGALTVGPAAVEQTIAVVFHGATSFDLAGSVSEPVPGQSIGAAPGSTAAVSYGGVDFTITQGTTGFAAGDRWYFEVTPAAPGTTRVLPRDISFERLGLATGGAQTMAAGNAPIYWGRQAVFERTALVGAPVAIAGEVSSMGRHVVVDVSLLPALAVGDRVVLNDGGEWEEYLQVGRIQTEDDWTGSDLGAESRVWFSQPLRYAHPGGTTIQEVTLSGRREGLDYALATSGATGIDLVAGRFAAGNAVVASYRSDAFFGVIRAPGELVHEVFIPPTGDSEDLDVAWGDWTGLPLVDGTYQLGIWANRDFSVTSLGSLAPTEAWNNLNSDNTTYRMITPPATFAFLYGGATTVETRNIVSSGDNCNACHGDLQAHGFGRRGLETCMLCHGSPGLEDAAPYSFSTWYIGPTPGVGMEFRSLLHKVHMGKELANASTYTVNGIFLGTPYPVTSEEIGFPSMVGGASNCQKCHGTGSTAWQMPADRDHPTDQTPPVLKWRAACGSCHDSEAVTAHMEAQTTFGGMESCAVCHAPGSEWDVQKMHKSY